jgi:cell division initiation protein
MDVTPEVIHDVAFQEAKKGYNTQEVDDFLEMLAGAWARLQTQERDARRRVDEAEQRVAELERRAAEAEQRASESAGADETLKRTLVLAQRTADAAIKEAEEQANRTTAAAQEQANRMLAEAQEAASHARIHAEAEARRAQEDAQARVLEELRTMERARDQMRTDVEALEQHFDTQRERLRLSVRELQRLIDDPSALRKHSPPPLSDVAVPEPTPIVMEAPVERPLVAERPLVPPPDPEADSDEASAAPSDDSSGDRDEPEAVSAPPNPASGSHAENGGGPSATDEGPRTQPVAAVERDDVDDDAYLAELRKAMTDDSPLGPREDDDQVRSSVFETGADRPGRTRFGRRG